jgi:two-component system chemotaxis family response regulator WspR
MTQAEDMHMADVETTGPEGAITFSSEEYAVRVLLVDDQAMVGEGIRRVLAGQPGLEFRYCANPAQAIAAAVEMKPTVILQDLVMPGVDGLTLVREFRANPATRDVPIIVLSSKEEPAVKSQAFAAGANDYLVKLPDRIELIARVGYHSKAYLIHLQRDEAYRALRDSQRQLEEKNLELQRLTNVDGLTGLNNRRHFDESMEMEWLRAVRGGRPLSILMIDVDHFKQYNDSLGHLAGDEALKQVAAALRRATVRLTDHSARFGGEEFVMILPETDLAGTLCVGERIRGCVENLNVPHGASSAGEYLTVSIGGASTTPRRGESSLLLIDSADKSLYEAKHAGRNRVVANELVIPSANAAS